MCRNSPSFRGRKKKGLTSRRFSSITTFNFPLPITALTAETGHLCTHFQVSPPTSPSDLQPTRCHVVDCPQCPSGAALQGFRLLSATQGLLRLVCGSPQVGFAGRGRAEAKTLHLTLANVATDLSVWCRTVVRKLAAPESHQPRPFPGLYLFLKIYLLIDFWLPCPACGILVPQPGIKPVPPAAEARSPNHWTAREFPSQVFKLKSWGWDSGS